jgi:predicted MFS family arabinose efflux permease
MAWCFYINAISFAAVIGALLLMKVRTPPTNEEPATIISDLKAGLSYIRSERTIAALICMGVIPSLFVMPYPSMMLIISKDILKAGVVGYSSMMMATGVGALIGALSLAHRSSTGKRGVVLLCAAACDAAMLILVALSRNLLLTRLLMVGVGFMTVTYNAMMNTLIQSLSSDKFRGRVVSANIFTMMGLSPLASLQAGTVAHVWGAPTTLTIGGVLFAGMAAIIFFTRQDVRDL